MVVLLSPLALAGLSPLHVFAQASTVTSGGAQTGAGTVTSGGNQTNGSNCGGGSDGLTNPLNNICSLSDLLAAILDGVVQIGSIFLTFMLVYVGFLFVAARGNAEKIQGAREALVWTVIGGLILLGATAIGLVIKATAGSL